MIWLGLIKTNSYLIAHIHPMIFMIQVLIDLFGLI